MTLSGALVDEPRFAPSEVEIVRRANGEILLRSPQVLAPGFATLSAMLQHWAERAPDRVFLAERAGTGWRKLTYGAALTQTRAIAQAVLDRGLSADRPVAVLAENGIDHALLMLGAVAVGVPVAPISPAYARPSQDYARLKAVMEVLRPGLVYAADMAKIEGALLTLGRGGAELVVSAPAPAGLTATPFEALLATRPSAAADAANRRIGPDTIAKFLFTSGSTGTPKGVINTHRMMCSNQESLAQIWPFLARRPPVVLDWLPWNHTFGGNFVFNLVLRNGGSLYIDEGKPTLDLIGRTVANLREISPTVYFNVPRGYDMLLRAMEQAPEIADHLFRDLDMVFYAGAALPQTLWRKLEDTALQATGRKLQILSSWGSTETAPMACTVHFANRHAANIGLPIPGSEIKLVPTGGKLEIRVRGPNITPGYWRRVDLTRQAFDGEGFFRSGDAGTFLDPSEPRAGLLFDGRIAEDFKLSTGTWVHVGALRVAALAAGAPIIEDAVVTGHDRAEIGLLVFPSLAGCRAVCPEAGTAPLAELVKRPALRARLAEILRALAARATGSATRITRALLMDEPPSIDANEITDKGYINQRAVLTRRAALIEILYQEPCHPDVVLAAEPDREAQ